MGFLHELRLQLSGIYTSIRDGISQTPHKLLNRIKKWSKKSIPWPTHRNRRYGLRAALLASAIPPLVIMSYMHARTHHCKLEAVKVLSDYAVTGMAITTTCLTIGASLLAMLSPLLMRKSQNPTMLLIGDLLLILTGLIPISIMSLIIGLKLLRASRGWPTQLRSPYQLFSNKAPAVDAGKYKVGPCRLCKRWDYPLGNCAVWNGDHKGVAVSSKIYGNIMVTELRDPGSKVAEIFHYDRLNPLQERTVRNAWNGADEHFHCQRFWLDSTPPSLIEHRARAILLLIGSSFLMLTTLLQITNTIWTMRDLHRYRREKREKEMDRFIEDKKLVKKDDHPELFNQTDGLQQLDGAHPEGTAISIEIGIHEQEKKTQVEKGPVARSSALQVTERDRVKRRTAGSFV